MNTNLLRELLGPDFDESGGDGLHVGLDVVEGDATRADRILKLVGVNA